MEYQKFESPRQVKDNIYVERQQSMEAKLWCTLSALRVFYPRVVKGGLQEGELHPEYPTQVCISCDRIRIYLSGEQGRRL